MHKALYRKYRPLIFDDVIGQEHIVRTLKNQIKNDSLSHAYLFCGTRGTGKTTTAKILSRAVNCTGDSPIPCNKCQECTSILDGSNLDVIEIDAASNNSVDDIRELRDTVKYTPNNSKYKVYIIDEVHMLSQGAFNALLKTLEEPPSYVIFILATTEPNKIPATILSRCQRFDFKRVSIEDLMDKMRSICEEEKVEIDEDALKIIARNGQGSVRDALSILDKCVAFGSGKLKAKDVLELLGSADPSQLLDFARAIFDSNVSDSMKMIDDYFMWGKDLKILVQDTTSFFRSLMMIKIYGKADDFMDLSSEYEEEITKLANSMDMEEIIRILSILSELMDKLKYSSNQRMTLEIYIMKLSSPATDDTDQSLVKRLENIEKIVEDGKINITSNVIAPNPTSYIQYIDESNTSSNIASASLKADDPIIADQKPDMLDDEELQGIVDDWDRMLEQMRKDKRMPLRAFLVEKLDLKYKNEILYVIFNEGFTFAIDRLKEEDNYSYIKSTMRKVFGLNIEPRFILEKDVKSMNFGDAKEEDSSKEEEHLDGTLKSLKETLGDKLEIQD
ncbi:MAG: DNA polymerase III subunit gamma/tau [Peptostreptococcus sp.]|uniref:DNA polymerase III subunit gamma/tau n=1 Tax=Peptostreptococcus sp. TaxID=1262 RepID=UPI002FC96666